MVIEARDRRIDDLTNDATPEASDHQRIRARARLSFLSLSLSAPLSPARNHLLCTWLEADCYPGILPFLRLSWPASSPDTWSRSTAIAIARISFSVRDRPPIENGNKGAFEVSRSILDTRGNLSLCLCFNFDFNSLAKVADFIARDFIALCIIFVLRWLRSCIKVEMYWIKRFRKLKLCKVYL